MTFRRTYYSVLIIALGFVIWTNTAHAVACGTGDLTGLFDGKTDSPDGSKLDVLLNIRCDAGKYRLQFFTSAGDFESTDASYANNHLKFTFDNQVAVGSADLTLSGKTLFGSYVAGGDRGTMSLVRKGDPLGLDALKSSLDLTPAQWREDLKAFATEFPKYHANAFFSLPKAQFDAEIADLDQRLDKLNDDEVLIGLAQILNSIGDGHTSIVYPHEARFPFPIKLTKFGNEIRVTAVGPGAEKALGARVIKIADMPIQQAYERAMTMTPRGELDGLRQGVALVILTRGLYLHGLGITSQHNNAIFTLQDDSGKLLTMNFHGSPSGDDPDFSSGFAPKPLWQQRADEPFWCVNLAKAATVYCAFRSYQNLDRNAADMFALLKSAHPSKLVIDMRDNGGGDNTVGDAQLIKPLKARGDFNRKGRLYVLIGPLTFSAAMNNAAQFQDETNAILVGETIGEKPNSYQEPRQFRLPNSHLVIRASTLYYEFRKKGENAVRPDKEIIPTWDDIKAGRDPVLDWVLMQPTG
jgi:hypothetical protein